MGGCIWRGQGPKSVGPCPTRGEVLPLDGARVQPGGHVRLPAAHSRLRHLGHGLSRASWAGVHPLEVLGWSQLHLALHWGTGSHSFVIQFFCPLDHLECPQDGWALFVAYIYFSKYGSIRLGREDSRPEYNDLTWSVVTASC